MEIYLNVPLEILIKKNREGVLSEFGSAIWNNEEKRLQAKFKNKPCLSCKLLPVCNGGCSQVALENEGKDYCVHNFDENKKNAIIFEIIEQAFQ